MLCFAGEREANRRVGDGKQERVQTTEGDDNGERHS